MYVKSAFSIKDLENLSGIKAHTIRIWEKRYELLSPDRSDTNIRSYSLESLQKILNVSFLVKNGMKVSKIAELPESELNTKVKELSIGKASNLASINAFKMAMVNFDQELFENTYNQLLAQKSFREVFLEVFLDLLTEIGILWITKSVSPAQEHFISILIKQKLLVNIERFQNGKKAKDRNYVLFLPDNEIHEIGLLYVHFELLLNGFNSIYLGPSVPMEDLKTVQSKFENLTFVSYFTVYPSPEHIGQYLSDLQQNILEPHQQQCICLGRNVQDFQGKYDSIEVFSRITDLLNSEKLR